MKKVLLGILAIMLIVNVAGAKVILESNGCQVRSVTVIAADIDDHNDYVDRVTIVFNVLKDGIEITNITRTYDISTPSGTPNNINQAIDNFSTNKASVKASALSVINEYTN